MFEIIERSSGFWVIDGETIVEGPFDTPEEAQKEILLQKVVAEIKSAIELEDLEAVFELLSFVPEENLKGFLPE